MNKNFSVIIRTYNEQEKLPRLLEALKAQSDQINEVIIVDSGSTDDTITIAKSYGVKIIRIPHGDFSYSYSLNVGIEAAKSGNIAVYSAHSLPVFSNSLKSAKKYLEFDKVAGVYGPCLADNDASISERIFYSPGFIDLYRSPKVVERPRIGVMGNTNSFFKKENWQEHRFDLEMGEGGEDSEWAFYWTRKGYKFILEPKTAVYHSHGKGLISFIKQYRHWQETFNKAKSKYE
jgi:rhamnosyltransferase